MDEDTPKAPPKPPVALGLLHPKLHMRPVRRPEPEADAAPAERTAPRGKLRLVGKDGDGQG